MVLYAPIILFVYNRPIHTKRTVEALKQNKFACDSDLIIYSDGPSRLNDSELLYQINKTRDYLSKVKGFKSLTIIERETNYGLAKNIIEGVSEVIQKTGKAIILEDDIITSPAFLAFMNNALNHYASNKQIWHISGWSYPFDINGLEELFFWRIMNCWEWATWSDRWAHYEKNPIKIINSWTKQQIKDFNVGDSNYFWKQVKANKSEKLNTWAVFWYATIFENSGLCLNPVTSYTYNIGMDGSGEHFRNLEHNTAQKQKLNRDEFYDWPIEINESGLALKNLNPC